MRLIRVMCSGRVDLAFVIRAFRNGMDGVFIGGCRLNECHYITDGNYHALGMVLLCKSIMEHIKLSPERLRIEGISAGEGILFAGVMNEFAKRLKDLGPLGKGPGEDATNLGAKLDAVARLVPYLRLVERERFGIGVKSGEAYEKFYASGEFRRLFKELVADKLAIGRIMALLRKRPLTTGEISEIMGLSPSETATHMNRSSMQGLVRFDAAIGRYVPAADEGAV